MSRNEMKGGKHMNKKKKKKILVIALLIVFGLTAGYVANTYAKYTAQINGQGAVKVAKWAFAEDNQNVDFVIDLDGTIDASTLIADRIAPGTSGSFDIELSNEHSEVGVAFAISFSNIQNAPSNLVFKSGSTVIDPTTQNLTGKIAAGDTLTIKIDWEWPYYTSASDDVEDTADGVSAKNMTVNTNITGTQVEPGSAITTGLDS